MGRALADAPCTKRAPIQISDHFTFGRLMRFTGPSIAMMVFTSLYGIVDGLFVSNFAGKTPFAAVNLIMPLLMLLGTFGFMMGTGGSAIVAKTLGEGDEKRAARYFSLFVRVTVEVGLVLTVVGIAVVPWVARFFGAEGELLEYCTVYGRVCLVGLVAFMLENVFQSFLVAAGKPKLGLAFMVGAGVTNMVFDALFIGVLGWGVAGAAVATVMGYAVGGLLPLAYFARANNTPLRLHRPRYEWRIVGKACLHGSSELMTNVSASLVGMLYNWQLMRMIGEDGVSAYGVIMYVAFVFAAVYLGYSIGMAPLVSFNLGARNHDELRNLRRKGLAFIASSGVVLTLMAQLAAGPWARVFVGYDPALLALTEHALRIYALSFLICGFNIFGSAFFTALNNGLVSAAISFLRTLVFECGCVLVIPLVLGIDGIWLAIVVAELAALAVTAAFMVGLRKRYGY